MASIRKIISKSGKVTFNVRIRIQGYPTITKTFNRKTDAEKFIQQYEPNMKIGLYVPENEAVKHTLGSLIDDYLKYELPKRTANKDHIKHHLLWWKDHLGGYSLNLITQKKIVECKHLLETEGSEKPKNGNLQRSPATVNRYLSSLSIVLKYACNELEYITDNPMHKVSKYKEVANKTRFLEPEEIARLLNACNEFKLRTETYNKETHLFVNIALCTGARYSEILNLKWENVDLKNRLFYFLHTKNGENRSVPIINEVYNELKGFKKVRNIKSDYLFTTKDGSRLIDMHVRFNKVLKVADIKNCRFHDLRHTVASHIAMNGGSILEISEVTGHKSMQMVKRYSHLTKDHTAKLMESTSQIMFSEVKDK